MSCIIEGKQCTACCRAINLKYSRRQLVARESIGQTGYDQRFVLDNWKPMKRRVAKKKNPYQVRNFDRKELSYWQCKKVSDAGCTVYETRPPVCRDFPLYGHRYEHAAKVYAEKNVPPEYHPQCTEFPRISAVNLS